MNITKIYNNIKSIFSTSDTNIPLELSMMACSPHLEKLMSFKENNVFLPFMIIKQSYDYTNNIPPPKQPLTDLQLHMYVLTICDYKYKTKYHKSVIPPYSPIVP